ncbi:alkaline exonuclease [Suid alphaherpesvirus 1]|uniref:Cytoplasmic envelopment protein 3 n=1 Tax=Suid herpesvirus 1 TaxID=10345 RepID=A0A172XDF8_SUHV|nr:alkaline exonuclease [Suid alphaherpesvirus 1]
MGQCCCRFSSNRVVTSSGEVLTFDADAFEDFELEPMVGEPGPVRPKAPYRVSRGNHREASRVY